MPGSFVGLDIRAFEAHTTESGESRELGPLDMLGSRGSHLCGRSIQNIRKRANRFNAYHQENKKDLMVRITCLTLEGEGEGEGEGGRGGERERERERASESKVNQNLHRELETPHPCTSGSTPDQWEPLRTNSTVRREVEAMKTV